MQLQRFCEHEVYATVADTAPRIQQEALQIQLDKEACPFCIGEVLHGVLDEAPTAIEAELRTLKSDLNELCDFIQQDNAFVVRQRTRTKAKTARLAPKHRYVIAAARNGEYANAGTFYTVNGSIYSYGVCLAYYTQGKLFASPNINEWYSPNTTKHQNAIKAALKLQERGLL